MKIIDFLRDIFNGKDTVYITEKLEAERYKLAIEDFAIQMAINLIAGAIAKCEFKTYVSGKEVKGDEYYIWNVEPNDNQNSSQYVQEFISKLLYYNESLVVEPITGKLIIADSFSHTEYALYPDTFTGVARGNLTFGRSFNMPDVLYFKLGYKDIRVLLSHLMAGYSELLDMAIGKYKRAGGRKGIAKVDRTLAKDEKFQKEIDDIFNNRFKSYFQNENAVIHMPNGIDYEEITGEGSKKSTSEINDISNITKEAFSRVAQAFRIPPALLIGDIAEVGTVTDNFLTFCIDPLVDMVEAEIIRKRYGKKAYLSGTYLKIDTTCIKHVDIFSIAEQADKLISSGLYSIDDLRTKVGDLSLNTWWSQKHWITKNYSDITAAEAAEGGGNGGNGKTDQNDLGGKAAGANP